MKKDVDGSDPTSDRKVLGMIDLDCLAVEAHALARSKGFWPVAELEAFRDPLPLDPKPAISDAIVRLSRVALIATEVGELGDAIRDPGLSDHCPSISNEAEELADIVIRVADYAAARGIPLGFAVQTKMLFNRSRHWKHGGKLA